MINCKQLTPSLHDFSRIFFGFGTLQNRCALFLVSKGEKRKKNSETFIHKITVQLLCNACVNFRLNLC